MKAKKVAMSLGITMIVLVWAWLVLVEKSDVIEKDDIGNLFRTPLAILDTENPEEESSNNAGSLDGSGVTSDNSETGDSGGTTCSMKQISYSLINFVEEVKCNNFVGDSCTDFSITCSVEVHNLDDSAEEGFFKIKWSVLDNSKAELDSEIITDSVPIGGFKISLKNFSLINFQGFNEPIICSPEVIEIPEKEVCN